MIARLRALLLALVLFLAAAYPYAAAHAQDLAGEGFRYQNGILVISSDSGMETWLSCKSELPVVRLCLQDGVSSVPYMAFYRQTELKSLSIGATLSSIGAFAFSRCDALRLITVSPANPYLSELDGALYTADLGRLLLCPRDAKTLTLPASVSDFESDAFDGCTQLESLCFAGSPALTVEVFGALSALRRMAFLGAPPVSVQDGLFSLFADDFSVVCTAEQASAFAAAGESDYLGAPLAAADLIGNALPALPSATPEPTPVPSATPEPTAAPSPTPEPTAAPKPQMSAALSDALGWFCGILLAGACAGLWFFRRHGGKDVPDETDSDDGDR